MSRNKTDTRSQNKKRYNQTFKPHWLNNYITFYFKFFSVEILTKGKSGRCKKRNEVAYRWRNMAKFQTIRPYQTQLQIGWKNKSDSYICYFFDECEYRLVKAANFETRGIISTDSGTNSCRHSVGLRELSDTPEWYTWGWRGRYPVGLSFSTARQSQGPGQRARC